MKELQVIYQLLAEETKDSTSIENINGYNILKARDFLKEFILKQEVKEIGKGKQFTTIKKVLASSKSRPILQKVLYKDDTQIFTDSVMAFLLRGNDKIDQLKDFYCDKDEIDRYPQLDRIISLAKENKEKYIIIDTKDFLSQSKLINEDENCFCFKLNEIENVWFNVKLLTNFLTIINRPQVKLYYKHNLAPFYFIDENTNTEAIILPIRKD
jgi:hypothetical protein